MAHHRVCSMVTERVCVCVCVCVQFCSALDGAALWEAMQDSPPLEHLAVGLRAPVSDTHTHTHRQTHTHSQCRARTAPHTQTYTFGMCHSHRALSKY